MFGRRSRQETSQPARGGASRIISVNGMPFGLGSPHIPKARTGYNTPDKNHKSFGVILCLHLSINVLEQCAEGAKRN